MHRSLPLPLALLTLTLLPLGCGTDVAGPSPSLLSCVFGERSTLALGQVHHVQGAANRDVCISSDGPAASDFVFIPFFGAPAPGEDEPEVTLPLALRLLEGGVRVADASRSPDPGGPVLMNGGGAAAIGTAGRGAAGPHLERDPRFHDWLRRREIEELTPLIRPIAPGRVPVATPPAARSTLPEVGELRTFNVAISCTEEDLRTGRVVHVSDHAIVVADTANPAELTPQDYAFFGITFDTLVHPVETAHFGEPVDIDGNGRSILFFTRAVNERNPRDAISVTIGFFWSGDLFPEQGNARLQACPAANQAEMFYLIAPDPNGVVGPEFSLERVRRLAIPLIGHEFQHLVNASRRLFVNDATALEDPWLNEGLSHVAEELLFFAASGLQTLDNIGEDELRAAPNGVAAFNEYMSGNLGNFRRYLERPDTASLMGIDLLATRGAAWAFLRYAAGRTGRGDEAFFFDLVNSRIAGLDNLADVLAPEEPLDWMRDWTVSVYADDFVDGVEARFTDPTWNLRSVYEASTVGFYPLEVLSLAPGSTLRVDLQPGGAVYTGFGVGPRGQAVVHLDAGEAAPPAPLRGSFLRVR